MVVTIYMALERMDEFSAGSQQKSGGFQVYHFRRVVFPLSLPGVLSGVMIVFVPTLGTFVEPRILGGTDGTVIGTIIEDPVLRNRKLEFRRVYRVSAAGAWSFSAWRRSIKRERGGRQNEKTQYFKQNFRPARPALSVCSYHRTHGAKSERIPL